MKSASSCVSIKKRKPDRGGDTMEPVRTLAAYLLTAAMAVTGLPAATAEPNLGEGDAIPTAAALTATPQALSLIHI